MRVELERRGGSLRVAVDGNIDTEGARELGASLQEASLEGIDSVAFDLSTVRAISSAAIGKLLNFFKLVEGRNGRMSIDGISDQLYRQFMEIHLDRVFPISKRG